MELSQKKTAILWKITGLVAAGLLLVTIALAFKARAYAGVEVTAYIAGPSPSVYLREKPSDQGKIITILKRGVVVSIGNSSEQDHQKWYFIEVDEHSGWVPEPNISLTPP